MNNFLTYINKKWGRGEEYTPHNISWNLSPKINAVQRSDDMKAKQLLFMAFVGEADKDEATEIAFKLHKEQIKKTKIIYEEIKERLDNSHKVIICFGKTEHKNYLGLVANKIMEEYNKPTIILRESNSNFLNGSLRSPFPITELINQSKLAVCQGHSTAAGISMEKNNLQYLIEWFDKQDLNVETIKPVTACINPFDITLDLCHDCIDNELLWCGGEGGKVVKPRFYVCFETLPSSVSIFIKKTNTARFDFGDVSLIKFKVSKDEVNLLQSKKCKIEAIIELDVNVWNDVETPQGKINAWEINEIEENEDDWMEWF